jgi:hypothetical protein
VDVPTGWSVHVPRPDPGRPQARHHLGLGQDVRVGRVADVPVGVDPLDVGVSRQALVVRPTADGWRIEITNSNGATVHPWGLAPLVGPGQPVHVMWPFVAVRVHGVLPVSPHWVLLETDQYPFPSPRAALPPVTAETDLANPPLPLTPTQDRAVRVVFEPQLSWPPSVDPPRQIKQAARLLGVGDTAVQKTLGQVRSKARKLGLARAVELTQPDYVHVLVAAGYLAPRRP